MRVLYHLPLHPGCRKIRVLMREKKLDFELKAEQVWERREGFLRLNPAGEVPVLVEDGGAVIPDAGVIAEYLEETCPEPTLLGHDPMERAEVRRLALWFDAKFNREVTINLVDEKILKRFMKLGHPDSQAIRAGHANIHYHLDYIAWLCDRRTWLAGDDFSMADIAAAAQLSCVDYVGDVPWEQHQGAKDWYARVKSRPSFRGILADQVPGLPPPSHYADLDF
ncbi:glutathione S-transferase family protein [Ferruginivarius sediminum]|uniref:Glutathione S-transferase family protein n=1 Tax=Ferruginivarius sediminum TaxID=2661937 RepID=A0A369TBG1_9PROT|nr:glutathione S-transferase family protein [Ferruginivarius sediminum]RDD61517.1 glutathione S-transferase family protein [Ferruginivarius sediminum]